jgi:uncharacterized membrane protein YtjA (UPF0391 family)
MGTDNRHQQATQREGVLEKASFISAILSLVAAIAGFTQIQAVPAQKVKVVLWAFLVLFLLITVPVYLLKRRPAKVRLLKQKVTRGFSEALDHSPFNPETDRRS